MGASPAGNTEDGLPRAAVLRPVRSTGRFGHPSGRRHTTRFEGDTPERDPSATNLIRELRERRSREAPAAQDAAEQRAAGPAQGAQARVVQQLEGSSLTLRFSGELNILAAREIAETVARISMDRIECLTADLRGVRLMDSAGLHTMLALQSRCAGNATELCIIPGNSAVQGVFEAAGVIDTLPFQGAAKGAPGE